jgi:HPP family
MVERSQTPVIGQEAQGSSTAKGIARLAAVSDSLWVPIVVGGLMSLIGALGWMFGQPWLFASLGPTAYLMAYSPSQQAARVYNVVVGHLIGMSTAFAVVIAFGTDDDPSVFVTHQLDGSRILASGVALTVALTVELLLHASHPPAAATVLLITLGGFPPTVHSAAVILVGVLLLALSGEPLRRLRAGSASS